MQKLVLFRNVEEKTQEFCLRDRGSWDCKLGSMSWQLANGLVRPLWDQLWDQVCLALGSYKSG